MKAKFYVITVDNKIVFLNKPYNEKYMRWSNDFSVCSPSDASRIEEVNLNDIIDEGVIPLVENNNKTSYTIVNQPIYFTVREIKEWKDMLLIENIRHFATYILFMRYLDKNNAVTLDELTVGKTYCFLVEKYYDVIKINLFCQCLLELFLYIDKNIEQGDVVFNTNGFHIMIERFWSKVRGDIDVTHIYKLLCIHRISNLLKRWFKVISRKESRSFKMIVTKNLEPHLEKLSKTPFKCEEQEKDSYIEIKSLQGTSYFFNKARTIEVSHYIKIYSQSVLSRTKDSRLFLKFDYSDKVLEFLLLFLEDSKYSKEKRYNERIPWISTLFDINIIPELFYFMDELLITKEAFGIRLIHLLYSFRDNIENYDEIINSVKKVPVSQFWLVYPQLIEQISS